MQWWTRHGWHPDLGFLHQRHPLKSCRCREPRLAAPSPEQEPTGLAGLLGTGPLMEALGPWALSCRSDTQTGGLPTQVAGSECQCPPWVLPSCLLRPWGRGRGPVSTVPGATGSAELPGGSAAPPARGQATVPSWPGSPHRTEQRETEGSTGPPALPGCPTGPDAGARSSTGLGPP